MGVTAKGQNDIAGLLQQLDEILAKQDKANVGMQTGELFLDSYIKKLQELPIHLGAAMDEMKKMIDMEELMKSEFTPKTTKVMKQQPIEDLSSDYANFVEHITDFLTFLKMDLIKKKDKGFSKEDLNKLKLLTEISKRGYVEPNEAQTILSYIRSFKSDMLKILAGRIKSGEWRKMGKGGYIAKEAPETMAVLPKERAEELPPNLKELLEKFHEKETTHEPLRKEETPREKAEREVKEIVQNKRILPIHDIVSKITEYSAKKGHGKTKIDDLIEEIFQRMTGGLQGPYGLETIPKEDMPRKFWEKYLAKLQSTENVTPELKDFIDNFESLVREVVPSLRFFVSDIDEFRKEWTKSGTNKEFMEQILSRVKEMESSVFELKLGSFSKEMMEDLFQRYSMKEENVIDLIKEKMSSFEAINIMMENFLKEYGEHIVAKNESPIENYPLNITKPTEDKLEELKELLQNIDKNLDDFINSRNPSDFIDKIRSKEE